MKIPQARIVHRMPERVRFRIPSRKGDAAYFDDTARVIAETVQPERLEANPATGSLLIIDADLDLDAVVQLAGDQGLFRLGSLHPAPLAKKATAPLRDLSERIRDVTFGHLDLATLAFFALIGTGAYQLYRGNLRSPPWYTAFWYAMGIYLKSLADKQNEPDAS